MATFSEFVSDANAFKRKWGPHFPKRIRQLIERRIERLVKLAQKHFIP